MKYPNLKFIDSVVGKMADEILKGSESNCFNAVRNAFSSALDLKKDGPEEMLFWLASHCEQIFDPGIEPDLFVIWSSSDPKLSSNGIDVHELALKKPGYPFGLVIEHAAVILGKDQLFQKASPKPEDRFENVSEKLAFEPYNSLPWVKVTNHRFKR